MEDYEKLISGVNTSLFGFDTSALPYIDKQAAEEISRKRWEIEAERQRRSPSPVTETKAEKLQTRRLELHIAKCEKQLQKLDKSLGIKTTKRKRGLFK